MELELDISENSLATALYFIDRSEWDDAVYLNNVNSFTFTFMSMIQTDGTLNQYVDGSNSVTFTKVITPAGDRFELIGREMGKVYPSDVVAEWTTFPEGVYNILCTVIVDGADEPTNNGLIYQEALYAQTKNYLTELKLELARNMYDIQNSLVNDNFTSFVSMFNAKFRALIAAIDTAGVEGTEVTPGNVILVTNCFTTLNDIKSKYPETTNIKRYYDNRALR